MLVRLFSDDCHNNSCRSIVKSIINHEFWRLFSTNAFGSVHQSALRGKNCIWVYLCLPIATRPPSAGGAASMEAAVLPIVLPMSCHCKAARLRVILWQNHINIEHKLYFFVHVTCQKKFVLLQVFMFSVPTLAVGSVYKHIDSLYIT